MKRTPIKEQTVTTSTEPAQRDRRVPTHPGHLRVHGVNVTVRTADVSLLAVRGSDGKMEWFTSDELREVAARMDERDRR